MTLVLIEGKGQIEEELSLTDKNDEHVLAAAIASKSQLIITANLKDFPKQYLSQFKIKACHPDDLFLRVAKENKELFILSIKECYQKLKKPPKTLDQYLVTLRDKCQLTKTALFIEQNKSSFI
ncbi:PIN domain-containing protein [Legionella donaldsonii]|uniref:PIN domain-containing protein n=1 Tax=Legionella donaldsonii TaxID=45060 RepID=UPI0011C04FA7|nr:PIN domain-containing protein [Legionella donaldsonii]